MKENLTELVFIVDRSGSMHGLEGDTIGGFNATLNKHRELSGEAIVSTVLFDNDTMVLHDRLPIAGVKDMTAADYEPRGCTALLDAVGGGIKHIKRVHSYLPDEYRPAKTIFVVITDGFENASRKYGYADVRRMVEQQQELGWEFLFLGANMDAIGEAAKIGIAQDRAATYMPDSTGQLMAYEAVADATCMLRSAPTSAPRMGSSWRAKVEADTKKRGRKRK